MAPYPADRGRDRAMIVDVTYVYEANVIAQRKRTPQNREFVATIPVEIEEIASADLPVAMRFEDKRSYDTKPGHVREIRWSPERGHWQPDVEIEDERGADGRPAVQVRDAQWLKERTDARSPTVKGYGSDPFGLLDRSSGRGLTTIEEDPGVARIKDWTREERAAAIRESAAGMVLVDGVLHERTKEPVYKVSEPNGMFFGREKKEHYLYIERLTDGVDETHAAGSLYRADERDLMLSLHKFGDDIGASLIEVLIPEAVRAPLPEMALVDAGKKLADNLKDKIHERDRDFFSAYADVRDTVNAYRIEMANADINLSQPPEAGTLSAVLQETLAVSKAAQPDYYGWLHKRVERACERYDARALGFEMQDLGPQP